MSSKTPLQLVITGSQTISITELFHRLNRVLPEDQEVRTLQPNMKAPEAIRIMVECGFSQFPVVAGNEVLGVFSYRSFARTVLKMESKQWKPDDLSVDDCVEKPAFARVTDEFEQWFDHLDNQDYILVGEPGRLQGIVTAMDVLRYLYGVASPYVLMAEIELAIRAMIRWSVNEETLAKFARLSLATAYKPQDIPETLENMSFNDYVQIIGDGRSWPSFVSVFGGTRERTRVRLVEVRDLRNIIFHFKRDLSVEDHEILAEHRNWMLMKLRAIEAVKRERDRV